MRRFDLQSLTLVASIATPAVVVLLCLAFPNSTGRSGYIAIYFAPAIGGFLLWLHYRLRAAQHYRPIQGLLDLVVLATCSLRMNAPLVPMSGHMLFFVYAWITVISSAFRVVMTLLILETSIIKLWYWGDYRSWAWGTCTGIVLGLMFRACLCRADFNPRSLQT